ncbi:pilus assembly protein [Thermohalobacter berrensis]|uniref:Pilus assembly protein n=2 Tax=Thermohalobacter berrensis TaxID=99594 RepID=A0A419SUA5_9FIRM|nr:pilus assembly protein [Thermohalobacter berrensis]
MINYLKLMVRDERGQGMVEYALIIALIAILLIGGLTALQGGIGDVFTRITNALGGSSGTTSGS